jgi:hypothetical protein
VQNIDTKTFEGDGDKKSKNIKQKLSLSDGTSKLSAMITESIHN